MRSSLFCLHRQDSGILLSLPRKSAPRTNQCPFVFSNRQGLNLRAATGTGFHTNPITPGSRNEDSKSVRLTSNRLENMFRLFAPILCWRISMSSKKYRVAVIGHTKQGNYGHGIDTVWLELDNVEIVAVADPDEPGRETAKKRLRIDKAYSDYRLMLEKEKPDIVAVCPRWVNRHHEMVMKAISAGHHVYMEKPFCQSLKEADEIVKTCEAGNVKLAIAHQTRYSPKVSLVKRMLEDGAIGKPLEIRGRGKEDRRGGGEDLWVLGSHIMNLIQYFGGEPNWCYAQVLNEGKPATKKDIVDGAEGIGPLTGDHVRAMYGLQNGITGHFDSVRNVAGGRFGIQILGAKGVIEVLTGYLPAVHILQDPGWSPGRSQAKWQPVSSNGIGKPETRGKNGLHDGNVAACKDLIQAIEDDRLPECNYYEARATVEMIASVFESHRIGKPVSFPLKNRENPLSLL